MTSELDPVERSRLLRVGAVRGVAGCLFTLATGFVGVLAGGALGWEHTAPLRPRTVGSEWHGMNELVEKLAEAGIGVVAGGAVGTAVGVAASVLLLRGRRPRAGRPAVGPGGTAP